MPRGPTQFNDAVSAEAVAPVLLVRILNMPHKTDGTLDFDGVDDYVDCGNGASLNITGSGSIEAWINVKEWGSHYDQVIWKKGPGWADIHYGILRNNTEHKFVGSISDGVNCLGSNGPKSSEIILGQWYHLAFTWDGTVAKIFTNGIETGSVSTSILPKDEIANILMSSYYRFDGLITEVRIWNVARTQAEIQADMNRTLTGNETGLVAYYSKVVPPTGNILPDSSINNNDGTIYGAKWHPIMESLYLTDYQEKGVATIDFFDENWNPCQYVCCNVKYDSIEVGADNTVNEVNITIDNVDRTFSALAQYYRLQGVEVHVLVAERSVLDTPEGAVMKFAGKLKEARINEHSIIIRVTSGYTLSCLIPKLMYDSKHFPYIPSAKDPRQVP